MSELRNFVDLLKKNLVKLPRPGGADDVQDIEQQADAAEEQADAAELQARAAADKARIMERLAALAGPYKEAVADNGPDAPRLHALFHTIKTSIGKRQFTEAAEGLDMLEDMLDERTIPPPGVLDDDDVAPRNHGLGVDDEQQGQDVSVSGNKSALEGFDPLDIPKDVLKTLTGPRVVKGKIVNHTDQTLELDEQGVNQELAHGEYKQFPTDEIKPGAENGEFIAVNKSIVGDISLTGVEGEIRYFLNDQQTVWTLKFDNPRRGDNKVDGTGIKGPDAARFESVAHAGNGDEAVFTYTLKSKGGSGPKPPTGGPTTCTCRISNNTDQTLQLDSQTLDSGDFKTPPPSTIAPKQQAEFVAISKSTSILDASLTGVEGRVRYFVDDQKTALTVHFANPRVGNSSADAQIDGPNKDQFENPGAVPGQGENATFLYTLNAKGGQGPGPHQEVNASCLIKVTNNTKEVLTLVKTVHDRGNFMKFPDTPVQPGTSTSFVSVQTPNENNPKEKGCKGYVLWGVGSTAAWYCEWDNPLGEKNTTQDSVDPPFQSLALIGQGDENVPVTFTLSGGGDGPVPPPDEKEPEYNPPVPEKQPTLYYKTPPKHDGWAEYLQQLLNSWMTAEPEKYKDPTPIPIDGLFNQRVLTVVREFQQGHQCLVDGIVGNETWAALRQGTKEKPSTDGRTPGTFEEKGAKARWYTEHDPCIYQSSADVVQIILCSVGEQKIEGCNASVFVTLPSKKLRGKTVKISAPYARTPNDEGDLHFVQIEDFKKKFLKVPLDESLDNYRIEAYFDQDLGGDRWKGPFLVK